MKVGILGAGAMGCMLGQFLARGGADVWLISRNRANMDAVAQNGIVFEKDGQVITTPVHAVTAAREAGICDVVIVLTKCPDTKAALEGAMDLIGKDTYVLSLQNGLGNETVLMECVEKDHVCYGTVNAGATMVRPGYVKAKGSSKLDSAIAFRCMSDEKPEICDQLAAVFTAGGIGASYSENIDEMIWKKATINVADSFLFAITQSNGLSMADLPETMRFRERIVKEMAEVAWARGIRFDLEANWNNYEHEMAPVLQDKYPSAVSDVYRCKPTEIDYLNGFISREGKRLGIPTPINDTITIIVHILEHTYHNRYSE